jgi:hypothetical protein
MLELLTRERVPLAPNQRAILASLENTEWGEEEWAAPKPEGSAWSDGDANGVHPATAPATAATGSTSADPALFPKLVSLGLAESAAEGVCACAWFVYRSPWLSASVLAQAPRWTRR